MLANIIATALRVVTFLSFIPIPVYTLTLASSSNVATRNVQPKNGSANAASDLYGLGMRAGVYLQVLGMLLYCFGSHKRSRSGIKLLSSAVCLAFLSSWTAYVSLREISPCEAWLVLSLINAYGTPRRAAIKHWKRRDGGGIGFAFSALSVVWESVSLMWFFTTLVRQLPLLGTNNRVWLFVSVDVSGWFRVVMLIYSSFCCMLLIIQIPRYLQLFYAAFSAWAGTNDAGGDEDINASTRVPDKSWTWGWFTRKIASMLKRLVDNRAFNKLSDWNYELYLRLFGIKKDMDIERKRKRWEKGQDIVRKFWVVWGVFVLALTIAGVEKIIVYNQLSPQNDLSQPGQMIPLVLGVITLIEGGATACMPTPPVKSGTVDGNARTSISSELDGEEQDEGQGSGDWEMLRRRLAERVQLASESKKEDGGA